jgi:hypothetical protein
VAHLKGEIKTFDVLTGAELCTFATAVKRGPMGRMAWTFSADGTHGVYFANSNEWVIHNAVTGRQSVLPIEFDGIGDWSYSHDSRFFAASLHRAPNTPLDMLRRQLGDTRYTAHVFDTSTGAEVCPAFRDGRKCGFAPDGKTLAVGGLDYVALWDWPAPMTRWPLMLALAAATMALAYGVGWWSSRRRSARAIT